jgi:hypothetical protein
MRLTLSGEAGKRETTIASIDRRSFLKAPRLH